MHASSYIHRLLKLVTDNTQPHSCCLAASQQGFSSADSVRLWHKTPPVSQTPPTALYASGRPSLCVPSSGSLCAGLGGLLWNVGGLAGLKGGAQFFPHTALAPH